MAVHDNINGETDVLSITLKQKKQGYKYNLSINLKHSTLILSIAPYPSFQVNKIKCKLNKVIIAAAC